VVLQDYSNSATSSCQHSTGFQSISEWISKLLHLHTSHLLLVSPLISLWYEHLIGLSGPSTQLIRVCYLCHAATAVSDKEVFPTVPLKSGMTPLSVRQSPSLDSFSRNLKTHYSAKKLSTCRLPPALLIRHSRHSALYELTNKSCKQRHLH